MKNKSRKSEAQQQQSTLEQEFLAQEREKSKNNQIKNGPILVITYMMVVIFLCMFGYIIYFMQFKSEDTIANSRNIRQNQFADKVERGDIITSDGVVIATSSTDEEGNLIRNYPYSNMFSHLVGYYGYGNNGLELTGNFYMLRSHINIVEKIKNELNGTKNRGDNLVTTVRYDMQEVAYNALGGANGAVIVMEPDTGKILAMVSKPDYDPNKIDEVWAYANSEEGADSSILLNRATQGKYAPGSTFKIITLLEYIRENPDTYENYTYTCEGISTFSGVQLHCAGEAVHGTESLADSLAYSCNLSFANIGLGLNKESFKETAEELLYNYVLPYNGEFTISSFDIGSQSDDSMMPQTVIGQGNTTTSPLHNALIVSAIANGGVLMKPYMMESVENDDGANLDTFSSDVYGELMTTKEAALLTEYMKGVCSYGTAASYFSWTTYEVAGKTGTAETDSNGNTNSWFVGFSNPSNPDIVVSAVVENSNINGITGTSIAKQIFDVYYANVSE